MPIWLEFDAPVNLCAGDSGFLCAGASRRPTRQSGATQQPVPAKPRSSGDLDDLDLPRRSEGDDLDEEASSDDDSDLGLPGTNEDESIGLDTSTGFEDSSEDLELPEDGEDQRWSVDSEEAGELPGADVDLFPGEEYGWIGDDEPAGEDDDFDSDLGDDELESRDDGGAEGLEDDSELDDLDLGDLPDIDSDLEEEASSSSAEGFEELAGMGLSDEPTVELAPGEHWKLLPERARRVSELLQLTATPTALAVAGNRLFVAAGSGWVYDLESGAREGLRLTLPERARLAFEPIAGPSAISSFAIAESEAGFHVAALMRGVVFVSHDGGRSFALQELPEPAREIGFTQAGERPRLWWLSPRGALRNLGTETGVAGGNVVASLGEALAFHADGARHLLVLVRRQERESRAGEQPSRSGSAEYRARLALSGDAGKRFSFHEPPPGALDPSTRVQVCRGALLLHNLHGVLSAQPPQNFERVSPLSHGPAALANEDDAAFVYSCVHNASEVSIVRRAVRSSLSAPMIVATLPRERFGEPQKLAVSYAEGGAVSLFLASDRSLLRVDASLDGEELA